MLLSLRPVKTPGRKHVGVIVHGMAVVPMVVQHEHALIVFVISVVSQ